MRSTKFYSATMVLGLVFALTATLAAQNGKASFDAGIGMHDACQPIANFAAQGCTSVLTGGPACYQSIVWVPREHRGRLSQKWEARERSCAVSQRRPAISGES